MRIVALSDTHGKHEQLRVPDGDLLRHVERVRPKLHSFGHIHEGYGMVDKEGTCFVNACNLNERYRMRNLAVVVDV